VLKYLFYLARIGVTTSVISNMSATIRGSRIPLMDYMSCGLLVSLSTQQPVFTHTTRVCVLRPVYSDATELDVEFSCVGGSL